MDVAALYIGVAAPLVATSKHHRGDTQMRRGTDFWGVSHATHYPYVLIHSVLTNPLLWYNHIVFINDFRLHLRSRGSSTCPFRSMAH